MVGETAALEMKSTFRPPLAGVRVCMTGTASFMDRLGRSLAGLGAETEEVSRLGLVSHAGEAEMQEAYGRLESYTWAVFTSANAVRLFFEGLLASGKDFRSLGGLKLAAVGRGTAEELLKCGFRADYVPERYQVEDLAAGLAELAGHEDRLLIPRSSGGSPVLNEVLASRKIPYDDICLYDVSAEWREREHLAECLASADYLTFASGSGVKAFFDGLSDGERKALDQVRVVCIGAVTARALEKAGRRADLVADSFDVPGMTAAILKDVEKR